MNATFTDALPAQKSSPANSYTFKPSGPGAGLLAIFTARSCTAYTVAEFRCQWSGRAFKLSKGTESYNVFICRQGLNHQCDCPGFTYHRGKPCKHVLALQAILDRGLITALPVEPKPAPQPETLCPAELDAF